MGEEGSCFLGALAAVSTNRDGWAAVIPDPELLLVLPQLIKDLLHV
eukprot:COSAG01_NODE_66957_length_268_cov_0.976331_1_plen_45_part_10